MDRVLKSFKGFGFNWVYLGFVGMKIIKTFRESSDHFELFGWYENSKDF